MTSRILNHPVIKFGTWWVFWTITGTILIHSLGFGWDVAFTDAAVTQFDWTLAGYALSTMLLYYKPSPKNLLNLAVFSLGIAGLFTPMTISFLRSRLPLRCISIRGTVAGF